MNSRFEKIRKALGELSRIRIAYHSRLQNDVHMPSGSILYDAHTALEELCKEKNDSVKEQFIIADYIIHRMDDGSVWISRPSGEAMETREGKLHRMIEDFWNREF